MFVIINLLSYKLNKFSYFWENNLTSMNQLARYLIAISIGLVICFLAWYFSNILLYILISAVLSLIGKPLMNTFTKYKFGRIYMPKNIAAFLTILIILVLFSSIFLFVAPLVGNLLSSIQTLDFNSVSQRISEPLADINKTIHTWFPSMDQNYRIEDALLSQAQTLISGSFITNLFTSVTNFVIDFGVGLFVVTFITFFFIKEQNMFNEMVIALFPDKYEPNITRALDSINKLLVRYFIGISIETIAITLLNGFGLYLIAGIDFSLAFVLAFFAGVLNVIPYIGPLTGGLFGVLMSLVGHGTGDPSIGGFIVTVALIFTITHLIDVFVFQPYIYSNSVRAHPLEIFIVILIAGSIAGILGMLVAIPAYTVIRVFAREFLSNFKLVKKLTDTI